MVVIDDVPLMVKARELTLTGRRPSFLVTPSLRFWQYTHERKLSRALASLMGCW
jgi:hypothetical protein